MKSSALLLGSLTASLVAVSAAAQSPAPSNEAQAEAQFNEGRKLMELGRAVEACPKFENSQRLDPALGTLLNLAECYEKVGLFASAWYRFNEAADRAGRDGFPEAVQGARERAKALEPRLAKVALRVAPPSPVGLTVTCDDKPLDPVAWTPGFPLDTGSHVIAASAPGRRPFRTTLVIDTLPGVRVVEVPQLAAEESASAPPAAAMAGETSSGSLGPKRTAAIVAGGVGIAGIAIGSIFGLKSMSKKDEADEHCDGSACRDQAGVDLRAEARSAGNVSTIAFILGGVGVAAGVTLWIVGGADQKQATLGLRLAPQGALLDGRF